MPALFGRERSGFGGRVAVGGEGLGGGGGNCVWDVIHSVSWDTLALFPTKQQILSVSLNSFIKGQ